MTTSLPGTVERQLPSPPSTIPIFYRRSPSHLRQRCSMESSRELQCFTTSLPSAAGPIASPLPSSLFFYPSPPHHSFTSLVQQSSRPSSSQPSDPARPSFSSRGGRVVVEIPRSSQPSSSKEEEKEEVLLPLDLYQEEERSGDHRSNIIGSGRERFVSSNSQSRPSPRRRRKPLPPPSTSLPPSSTCSTLPFQPLSTPDPSSTAPPLPLLPIGWSAGEWSCENPFIGEIPFKPEYTSERRATPAEFLLIQSAEESRTSQVSSQSSVLDFFAALDPLPLIRRRLPRFFIALQADRALFKHQACQACRIRKSKVSLFILRSQPNAGEKKASVWSIGGASTPVSDPPSLKALMILLSSFLSSSV